MTNKKEAYEIMNQTLARLYSIKELTSQDIVNILEEYANNEKWQIAESQKQ